MKKQIFKHFFTLILFIGAAQMVNAQRIFVKVQPQAVVVTRPAAPHPGYVWVDDEYNPNGGAYTRVEGHWVAPRDGYIWIRGHWVTERRGYYWVPGHWRRI